MKAITVIGLAAVLALGVGSTAQARDGCGRNAHRNYRGMCVSNSMGMHQTWVVGRYYPHRGYWDHGRWYHHRYHGPHGWRYR